jgi:hypothetical protein
MVAIDELLLEGGSTSRMSTMCVEIAQVKECGSYGAGLEARF